jgi:hypothetical protein
VLILERFDESLVLLQAGLPNILRKQRFIKEWQMWGFVIGCNDYNLPKKVLKDAMRYVAN